MRCACALPSEKRSAATGVRVMTRAFGCTIHVSRTMTTVVLMALVALSAGCAAGSQSRPGTAETEELNSAVAGVESSREQALCNVSPGRPSAALLRADERSLRMRFPARACALGVVVDELPERWNEQIAQTVIGEGSARSELELKSVHFHDGGLHGAFASLAEGAHPLDGDLDLHVGVLADGNSVSGLSMRAEVGENAMELGAAKEAARALIAVTGGRVGAVAAGLDLDEVASEPVVSEHVTPDVVYYLAANQRTFMVGAVGTPGG